jgi:hypothetical protein
VGGVTTAQRGARLLPSSMGLARAAPATYPTCINTSPTRAAEAPKDHPGHRWLENFEARKQERPGGGRP